MAQMRVLMICRANLCRSPTAEAVLRSKLRSAGLDAMVAVASAGTARLRAGEAPDPRATAHAAARGYDLSKLRSRQVTAGDHAAFDWLLAVDDDNLQRLRTAATAGGAARIGLLLEHSPRFAALRDIPDPYFGSAAGFERVLDLIEDACDGLVMTLLQSRELPPASLTKTVGFPYS